MTDEKKEVTKPVCGIVMPISAIDNIPEEHWADVLEILSEAIRTTDFEPNLVSSAEDIGVIQKRIIQNLYDNPVVVCDVSAKNPNVMFELGLRLAFDKPTIIIKDDKTSYSFDTSPIEHLTYPRDLRFNEIVRFKEKVAEKVKSTYQKAKTDKNFTPFLGHFGTFTVAKLESKEVSGDEFIIEQLNEIRGELSALRHSPRPTSIDEGLSELKGNGEERVARFVPVAKRAIRKYARDKGIPPRALSMNDKQFVQFVEQETDAPRYLRSEREFGTLLDIVLTSLH